MSSRLLLPVLSVVLLAAAPAPPAQDVLAANRQGLIEYCVFARQLELDDGKAGDALGRRRKGAGSAGDDAHAMGVDAKVMQGTEVINLYDLGARLNRPVRWLCNLIAVQASAPDPLPAELK